MQRLKNFNNISDKLYNSIPKLKQGEIKVFHMLNGIANPDPDIDERMKRPVLYGAVQLRTWARIRDPFIKNEKGDEVGGYVDIGLVKDFDTTTERPSSFKTVVVGKVASERGAGYFTLNGDRIEDAELYEILYLSPENKRNNTTGDALFEEVEAIDENETVATDLGLLSSALEIYNSFNYDDLERTASILKIDASLGAKALKTEIGKVIKADPKKFLAIASEINSRKKNQGKAKNIKQEAVLEGS